MRTFIAGAGGFLGIPLCNLLTKEFGHEVIAFDRYFFGRKPTKGEYKLTVVTGDIRDVSAEDLASCDAVVDLAGLSNDASCEIDKSYTQNINVDGALHLIRQANHAGVNRYIYSSSASVYGAGEKLNLTESDAVNPLTAYAESKLVVEKFLNSNRYIKYPVILRNATVFGYAPRMRFDLVVNAMVARAMLQGEIHCRGGGEQWRPLIHIDDAIRAIAWAIENAHNGNVSGETFNVGCQSNQMKIKTLASRVSMAFPNAKVQRILDDPDQRSYHLSFEKLKKVRPQARFLQVENGIWDVRNALRSGAVSFDDPTTMTVSWYKSLLEWSERIDGLRRNGSIL